MPAHSNHNSPAPLLTSLVIVCLGISLFSCEPPHSANKTDSKPTAQVLVGVVKVARHPIGRDLTLSSELVPFQEIDVFAKESGYLSQLLVDYGSRVKKGQIIAVLEIPELQLQLDQDRANLKSLADQVTNAEHQLGRVQAQHNALHLEYQRFATVAQEKPGLVAQQEVDNVQGRDLAAEAQVEAATSNVQSARSTFVAGQAKLSGDQALFNYSRITAPFDGVVTQRYANLGTLLSAGTNSSTQALPLVKLSQLDRFRLVIPVAESYVRYVHVGDPVTVFVPSLNEKFPATVARFSHDVHDDTRTMHTEVDVLNKQNQLMPGLYAEATISLNRSPNALTIPLQAVSRESEQASVAVVNPQGKVEFRQVQLGIEAANEVEVVAGLQEGEEVVVSDRAGLNAGQKVKTQLASPAAYINKS